MWNTPRHTCSSCSGMNRYLVGHTPQAVWLVMWDVRRKNTRTQCTHFCVLMCGVGDVFIPVTLYFSFPYPSSLPLMLPSFCLSSPSVEGQGYEDKHRITWLFLWALGLQKLPHSPASGNFLHHSLGEDIWDSLASHCLQFFCPLWLLCNVCKLHGMIVVSPFLFPHSWFLPVSVFLHQQQKKRRQQEEEEETVLFFSGMSHRAKFRALVSVLPSPPLPLLYSCSSCSPSMQMRLK